MRRGETAFLLFSLFPAAVGEVSRDAIRFEVEDLQEVRRACGARAEQAGLVVVRPLSVVAPPGGYAAYQELDGNSPRWVTSGYIHRAGRCWRPPARRRCATADP